MNKLKEKLEEKIEGLKTYLALASDNDIRKEEAKLTLEVLKEYLAFVKETSESFIIIKKIIGNCGNIDRNVRKLLIEDIEEQEERIFGKDG